MIAPMRRAVPHCNHIAFCALPHVEAVLSLPLTLSTLSTRFP